MADICPGTPVEVHAVSGDWVPGVAQSEPRIDWESLFWRQPPYESVSVLLPGAMHPVNWPVTHVRALTEGKST